MPNNLRKYLGKLWRLSPSELWQIASQPSILPFRMTAPPRPPLEAALALFPEMSQSEGVAYRMDYMANHRLFDEYDRKFVEGRQRRAAWARWHEFLYLVVRQGRPGVVFETGIFDGQSSAVILQALRDNDHGQLVSIDLPATEAIRGSTDRMLEVTLPPGGQPGWAVPDYLRDRYRIELGDSAELLPALLEEHRRIGLFLHDSLHTRAHMYWEYSQAWPRLSDGGLLLSDDVFWNTAFYKFCRERGQQYVAVAGMGATRNRGDRGTPAAGQTRAAEKSTANSAS